MNEITSRNNEHIKAIVRLKESKERARTGLFFIEGIHLAEEYLRHLGMPCEVFFTQKAYEAYGAFLSAFPEDIKTLVSDSVFEKMSTESSPQGILCVCKQLPACGQYPDHGSVLFLESLRDTGNLGTVIRTAVSLGVEGIVLSPDCADIFNPKTLRASMGAVFAANIYIPSSFSDAVNNAKQYGKVYAAALYENSLTLGEFKINKGDSFIIGNEGKGISEEIKNLADASVIIPMTGKTESLNAAAAASIIIWEMTRV